MTDESQAYFKRMGDFECNEVPDGYVIYDHVSESVHYLNLTAAAVFELCDGRSSAEAIADVLQDLFDLSAPPRGEVDACLLSLASQGLVTSCSPSSSAA
ncbi:PqqD family protein [Labrys monachus]|uniref:PqqD family protein n=1 Tax=Labrys monachus TaxID=217067 RepID=A0ABU0FBM4_9HYPH|nr:PqqD family protein [Labrys monachus]MDQ0392014.1 hypothetical protein [Labrys monachus]